MTARPTAEHPTGSSRNIPMEFLKVLFSFAKLRAVLAKQAQQIVALSQEIADVQAQIASQASTVEGLKMQHALVRQAMLRVTDQSKATVREVFARQRDVELAFITASRLGDKAQAVIKGHDRAWHSVLDKLEDENRMLVSRLSRGRDDGQSYLAH
jgi:hypothetical protein